MSRLSVCRVCGKSTNHKKVLKNLDQCMICGFITFNNFNQHELPEIYGDDYFTSGEYADYVGQQNALRRSVLRHLRQIARYRPRRDSLLEIGCAYGFFLDEARSHFKSVAGVDICATPTAYAREKLGLNANLGEFLSMDFSHTHFDVICLWDTIEHLAAPEAYLEKSRDLLTCEGMLFLTTGDIGSLNARWRGANWRQIHPPSHLHYFSRRTITQLLSRLGFEVVAIETASYYHSAFNVLAAIRWRGGPGGRIASIILALLGEKLARRVGLWVNLRDIMFVAAKKRKEISTRATRTE